MLWVRSMYMRSTLMQCQGWIYLLRGQFLQVHHLIMKGRGGNLGHVSGPGSQDNVRVDRNLSSTESSSSKGPFWSPARTIEISQEGTRGGLGGFNLLAPFRNLMMRSCFPWDRLSNASWCATYTFKMECDSLRSNLSCRKESTTPVVHLRGCSRWEEDQIANRLNFKTKARLAERALAWVIVFSTAGGRSLWSAASCNLSLTNISSYEWWTWLKH